MRKLGSACAAVAALGFALPGSVVAAPSLTASPDTGRPGDDVTLKGRGWTVGAGCSNRVLISWRQGTKRMKLGAARHGGGAFRFETHYQLGDPGPARFVARQVCGDDVHRRAVRVALGARRRSHRVAYEGQTERGGRVSFVVVGGTEIRRFRFVNRCSEDRELGSTVPGAMPNGDVSFARRGTVFTVFGRFRRSGLVEGTARQHLEGCDSGALSWMAYRLSAAS